MTDEARQTRFEQRPRVLCVDDEPAVLDSLRRQLYAQFVIVGVETGAEALARLADDASFSVLMSDMRMPGMDGATVLSKARVVQPGTVRVLLTGQADMEDAVAAVNDGNIFRFLIKPCPRPVLVKALTDAVDQHRMITAERVLLERTLRGSVAALFEVLSLANPIAFARATRIQGIVQQMIEATRPQDAWRIEIAAMLSQIGSVVLAPETVAKLNVGSPLDAEEQLQVHVLPWQAENLLAQIPRLEDVRRIIHDQCVAYEDCRPVLRLSEGGPDGRAAGPDGSTAGGADVVTGAQMLRIAVDLETLEAGGIKRRVALGVLAHRQGAYDPSLLDALLGTAGPENGDVGALQLLASELKPGMTLVRDVTDPSGRLLVGRGYQVSESLIERLRNLRATTTISEPIYVSAVVTPAPLPAVAAAGG